MATASSVESILIVDCGSTVTRAVLIDLVDGRYRFVAKGEALSTLNGADGDLLTGVYQAFRQVEEITGRVLLDEAGQLITPEQAGAHGVDVCLVVSNAGRPLKLVVVGLSDQVSLASTYRAVLSNYAVVEHVVSPDVGLRRQRGVEDELAQIQELQPDVILLTGGVDGGSGGLLTDLAEVVSLSCSLLPPSLRPRVIYAGNNAVREQVVDIIGQSSEVVVVENVRPNLESENLEPLSAMLNELYRQRKLSQLPGFETLAGWSEVPVMTSSRTFGYVIKHLAQLWGRGHNVMGVDIGATMTAVASVVGDRFSLVSRPDLGIGWSAGCVSSRTGIDNIIRWLPYDIDRETALNRVVGKQVRPTSLPHTREDLYLEQAVAREALRLALEEGGARRSPRQPGGLQLEIIVGSGGILTHLSQHGQAVLVLLDAIQPMGITTLWLDATSLAVPVGAVATVNPLAATQVMEGDAFLNLGTAICPVGGGVRPGDVILRLRIRYSDGRTLDVEVPYGSIEVIPLPLGEEAGLEVRPLKNFDIGVGPGRKREVSRLVGGMMGIIVDARGRPLELPADKTERLERLRQWYSNVGA